MAEKEKEKEKEKIEVITAIFKLNLHCHQCWKQIKKPLARTQGIQSVEVEMEKNEIRVKGLNLDVLKIHKQIEKLSKKRVELISPKVKPKDKDTSPKASNNNISKQILIHRTITAKVHLHCAKCEQDLKNKLLEHKEIYSVKTDMKAQTLTMEGTIEPEKFQTYMKKKLHKHADITVDKKSADSSKPPPPVPNPEPEKKKESTEKEKPKEKSSSSSSSSSDQTTNKIINENINVVNTKNNDVPYFIHYVYAPQMFSDENPNACIVM